MRYTCDLAAGHVAYFVSLILLKSLITRQEMSRMSFRDRLPMQYLPLYISPSQMYDVPAAISYSMHCSS